MTVGPFGASIPTGWVLNTLGELCALGGGGIQTGPFGSQLHASDYVEHGIPSVMPANIGDNRIVRNGIACISEADAQRLWKYLLEPGDIVYSRRGDVERRALVRDENAGWLCGTGCLRVRPGAGVSSLWLSYYLGHPSIREWIVRHAVGATMLNLNTQILSAIPVVVPPAKEQKGIAEVLSALDDKIELNRQTNQTLEALAQRLFKSWFVDFDPVKAKMAGRTPAHMDAETAALFPDRLVESEVGLIPEGWTPATIGNLVKLHYGKALKASERIQGEVPVYGSSGQVGKHDAALVDGPGIVVGRKGQPGLVHYSAGAFFPIDTTFYVEPLIKESWLYTYHALLAADLASWATDSAVPGLNRKIAYDVPWLRSDPGLIKAYEDTVNPLKERQNQLDAETQTLCELRDRLLPKLISGQLRVRDAERHVAEVV